MQYTPLICGVYYYLFNKDILLSDEEYEIQKTTSKTRYKAKR